MFCYLDRTQNTKTRCATYRPWCRIAATPFLGCVVRHKPTTLSNRVLRIPIIYIIGSNLAKLCGKCGSLYGDFCKCHGYLYCKKHIPPLKYKDEGKESECKKCKQDSDFPNFDSDSASESEEE